MPAYQGRVMTSTVGGDETPSHGWINYDLIASGKLGLHIIAFGGEDRFWLGPEGGQFSIFFKNGDPSTSSTGRRRLRSTPPQGHLKTDNEVTFRHEAKIKNYSDTAFSLRIDRTVRLFDRSRIGEMLGTVLPAGVRAVAYETENVPTNTGEAAWTKQGGLLSVWISHVQALSETTVLVPHVEGDEVVGLIVNADYFGTVPAERLRGRRGHSFSGDGCTAARSACATARQAGTRQLRRHPPTADPRAVH